MKQKVQLVIDCSSIAYAAFYTMGNLSYRDQKTGVIFGFLLRILSLSKKFKTNDLIFCWDSNPKVSKRKEMYNEYKEKRHENKTEEEVRKLKLYHEQTNLLRKVVLPDIGFANNYYRSGYEADDLIAAVVRANEMNKHIVVISSDLDLLGCIGLSCSYYNLKKKKVYNKKWFERKYCGFDPSWWWEAKSISGCNSDNVKGVKGVADPAKTKVDPPPVFVYLKGDMKDGAIKRRIELSGKIIKRNRKLIHLPFGGEQGWGQHIKHRDNSITRRKMIHVFNRYQFRYFLKQENFDEWLKIFIKKIFIKKVIIRRRKC